MGLIYFIITIFNFKHSQTWKIMYSTREQIFYLKGVKVTELGTHEDNIVDISDKLRLHTRQKGNEHSDPFWGHYDNREHPSGGFCF